MVLCWLYSHYANSYSSRERKSPAGYYHLCHRRVQPLCPLDYPEQIFFGVSPVFWLKKVAGHCGKLCHPTDLSVRWAERLEYEATKQIITKLSTVNYDHYAN